MTEEKTYCGRTVSTVIPLAFCIAFFAAAVFLLNKAYELCWFGILLVPLYLISREDLYLRKIRRWMCLLLLLVSVPSVWLTPQVGYAERIISFAAIWFSYIILMRLSQRLFGEAKAMGGGDVRMMAVMALLLGFAVADAVVIACISELAYVFGSLAVKGEKFNDIRKMKISFGPFLSLGTAAVALMKLVR